MDQWLSKDQKGFHSGGLVYMDCPLHVCWIEQKKFRKDFEDMIVDVIANLTIEIEHHTQDSQGQLEIY